MRLASGWLVFALLAVGTAGTASAYPQFQLSSGSTRCNQCHFAPAGGGVLNAWGRGESADTISGGGTGDFLHGLVKLPAWLALGGDVRGAGLVNANGATESPEWALFPMQLDLYSRFAAGAFSFNLTIGMRGAARPREPSLVSRAVSREHYFLWQPEPLGPYVRVGRFFAPFGLRLAEHPSFARRYLGFGLLEEPYALSGGLIAETWEAHATAFVPDFARPVGDRGKGGVAYAERRFGETAALGAQARVSLGPEDRHYVVGALGKLFWDRAKLLGMAEVDLVRQTFQVAGVGRSQLASYAGVFHAPLGGFMAGVAWERWDEDLAVRRVARDALAAQVHWFPRAHFEIMLYARAQIIGAGSGGDAASLAMLQVHYYP
jgi:hypothetical protein